MVRLLLDSGADPWVGAFTANAEGVAELSLTVPGFSIDEIMPVAGRALVVHDAANRIGCGVIIPSKAEVTLIGAYPGYSGSQSVRGVLAFSETQSSLTIKGTVTGLQTSRSGGWHVHAGDFVRRRACRRRDVSVEHTSTLSHHRRTLPSRVC